MNSPTKLLLLAAAISTRCLAPASAQTFAEFPLPAGLQGPLDIAAGADGNLWFTRGFNAAVGRITPSGVVTEFATNSPWPPGPVESSLDITLGPDGNLWYTASDLSFTDTSSIRRITPAGEITVFPSAEGKPHGITAGADGALWFTRYSPAGSGIGRITTSGIITGFPVSTTAVGLEGIASGPDGNLWFSESAANKIGRITTGGGVTEFSVPTSAAEPTSIAAGPDGALWFTERRANKIGRITVSGAITEFAIPTPFSGPADIVTGPDGALWFTESGVDKIGRITTNGVVMEFAVPTPRSRPIGIAVGPDGAIWFAEASASKIGRTTTGVVADPTQILPVVGSTPGIGGAFFRTSVQLHNSGATASVGGIVFHPSGIPGSVQDPVLSFTLAPGETLTIPDLLPAMELSGLGSADVILTLGSAGNVPVVSARVFNDAGVAGTSGFASNAVLAEDALRAGHRGVLLVPSDLTAVRLNLGVRTLNADVALTLTVRNAAGAIAAVVPKFFPAVYHEQQSANAFLNGLALPAGGSVTVLVQSGSTIVYGATVDNRTGDPSLQIARATP